MTEMARSMLAGACVATAILASGASIDVTAAAKTYAQEARSLVACEDPNNLPFSDQARDGFENKIAALLAKNLGTPLRDVWWAQRRGYVRNTLGAARCDIWLGVAGTPEGMIVTRPYYRSTYEFVTRRDRALEGLTLDDPRLKTLLVGVQMVGNDATNTPPAHALSQRGITQNVRGFMLYGDSRRPHPLGDIVDAVANGSIDVGIVWGPAAGYFASQSRVPLRLERVTPQLDGRVWPMTFDIAIGVRGGEPELRDEIDTILRQHRAAVARILDDYHVPRVDSASERNRGSSAAL